jgi:3-phenylpropionate/cinnamic acid dioxygenase small subunit
VTTHLLPAASAFLFFEARLLDERRYAEWESLWDDAGIYWVPAAGTDDKPDERVSIIYDTRPGIAARVKRLSGPFDYAQKPKSRLVRSVSNIEVEQVGADVEVRSCFVLFAERMNVLDTWAGRLRHRLRRQTTAAGFSIVAKRVDLIPLEMPLGNLSFIL